MASVKIKDDLYKDLSDFCKLNKISIVDYVNEAVKDKLNNEKYGDIPFGIIEHAKKQKQLTDEIEKSEPEIKQPVQVEEKKEEETIKPEIKAEIIKAQNTPKKRRLQ